jgi:uncharacterized protein (DUF488 family)
MQETIFTIGHSTHPRERLIELLNQHTITAVCDVRSTPYSQFNPQFDREELKSSLRASNISYVFLGKELGARSEDPSCYDQGRIQYDRLAHTALFRQGLERVQEGMKKFRIALMCAEKEPLECHRTILVARHLAALDVKVIHIHADGRLESHEDALSRLAKTLNLREDEHHMFRTAEDLLADAYRLQEERIAYTPSPTEDEPTFRAATG